MFLSWRYIFAFFLILAVSYFDLLSYLFPVTHENKQKKIRVSKILLDIRHITKTPYFWTCTITYGLINGYMIEYYAAMPYWFVVQFHMDESDYPRISS